MAEVFRFRLKQGDHHRYISVAAETEEEALETIERQEQKKVAFVVTDEGELKDLEARLKAGTLTGADKGKLFSHRQEAPYKIVKAD